MIIFLISHQNLDETVQMRGHNICFYAELTKKVSLIITKYSLLSRALLNIKKTKQKKGL